jgi:hypothetical protein
MSAYHLYAVDEKGRSVGWTHNTKGQPALHVPDDEDITIILEHPTAVTFINVSKNGDFEIEVE